MTIANLETPVLVITWIFVFVFAFTAIVTCLSMVGIVKFIDDKQQKALFKTLVVETVAICIGFVTNSLVLGDREPPPTAVSQHAEMSTGIEGIATLGSEAVDNDLKQELPASALNLAQTIEQSNPLNFDEITIGSEIVLAAKSNDQNIQIPVYDDRPRGLFGSFGSQIGVISDSQKLEVLGKYTTPARGFKWIRVRYRIDGYDKTGWFSWGNTKYNTFEI